MRRTNLYGLRFSEDLGGTLPLKEDRAIQDVAYGLRRGPLSRTRVNRRWNGSSLQDNTLHNGLATEGD
jgi:hypothetical protein